MYDSIMPSLSPLLALPGEIRNEIWRHLLCPYNTVDLHIDLNWFRDIQNAQYQNHDNEEEEAINTDEGEGENQMDEEGEGGEEEEEASWRCLRAKF